MSQHGFLFSSAIFLLSAILVVPIFKRLGFGSVLGYLLSGVLIGPFGLKLVSSPADILHFSELGVVFLLFLIGLELNPKELWHLRKPIFGAGGAQVLLSVAVFFVLGWWFTKNTGASLIAAMGFALSSTAIGLAILKEKGLMAHEAGHNSFAVLLFQDLAVIPMLAILPLLATQVDQGSEGWMGFAKALSAVALIVIVGSTILKPVFRYIAKTNLREIFTGFSLLIVLGTALLMDSVGLSMALGAFLAGVLLANSEYRHELESDIEPFKGLLLGLFFISVGMTIDFEVFAQNSSNVLLLVAGVLALKLAILWGVSSAFGLSLVSRFIFSIALSQGGEFAFVLFSKGAATGVLTQEQSSILGLVIAFSMATTPLLFLAYFKWIDPRLGKRSNFKAEEIVNQKNPVIIAGFGRVGGIIGRLLLSKNIGITVLDHDPNQIELVKKFGFKSFYGDVTRLDLLESAGIQDAKVFVIAIDDMDDALKTAKLVISKFPKIKIVARVRNRQDFYAFTHLGIKSVIRETFASSVECAEATLLELGYGAHEAHRVGQRFRNHDEEVLHQMVKHRGDERTIIELSKQARIDLEALMKDDHHRAKDERDWV